MKERYDYDMLWYINMALIYIMMFPRMYGQALAFKQIDVWHAGNPARWEL